MPINVEVSAETEKGKAPDQKLLDNLAVLLRNDARKNVDSFQADDREQIQNWLDDAGKKLKNDLSRISVKYSTGDQKDYAVNKGEVQDEAMEAKESKLGGSLIKLRQSLEGQHVPISGEYKRIISDVEKQIEKGEASLSDINDITGATMLGFVNKKGDEINIAIQKNKIDYTVIYANKRITNAYASIGLTDEKEKIRPDLREEFKNL